MAASRRRKEGAKLSKGLDQRRLAAVLMADVVGYSRMMEADESGTLTALKDRRQRILAPTVIEHGGRVVKYLGDGVLVEFSSAVGAVSCALALQERMAATNRGIAPDRQIVLRIGVNLGEIVGEGTDIMGDGVNVAARLEALATPGSVCLSAKVHDEVMGKLDFVAEDLGELMLKNMSRPVRAFRVSTPVAAAKAAPGRRGDDRISVAVLPFVNMSGKAEQDYFADGITEDLITELSRHRQLSVVSRTSSFAYKGKMSKVQDVGRELGAHFVVEGSVRLAGENVRITAQLIDAETGAHVWADRYDRRVDDIFAVQDEVVTAILGRFAYTLDRAASEQRQRRPTASPSAYDCVLRARAAWHSGQERRALDHLEQALAIDPNYTAALAQAAQSHAYSLFSAGSGLAFEEDRRRALDFAQRAVSDEPPDDLALHSLAATYLMLGQNATARRYVEAAAVGNPRNMEVMHTLGMVLAFGGESERGLALIEQAHRLAPNLPPSFYGVLSDVRYLVRDYEGSIRAIDQIVDPPGYINLCRAAGLAQLGRMDEARQAVERTRAIAPAGFDFARFARSCAGMCVLPTDREHWLEGFRKAGVDV